MKCKNCGNTIFYDTLTAVRYFDEFGHTKSIEIEQVDKISKYVKCSECGTVHENLEVSTSNNRREECKYSEEKEQFSLNFGNNKIVHYCILKHKVCENKDICDEYQGKEL